MWEEITPVKKLLPVQESIISSLKDEWSRKKRHGILCPRQPMVNHTVLQIAAELQIPTLIICADNSRYDEWKTCISELFGVEEPSTVIDELKLRQPIKPFTLTTYNSFCNEVNATPDQRYAARICREYELASVGSWSQTNDNIGDFDAVKETEQLLNEEAIRELSHYNSQLLRFIEIEQEGLHESGWLNHNMDKIIDKLTSEKIGLIICDESNEVTGIWAEALYYFMQSFSDCHSISLTPLKVNLKELSARNFQLQTSLFTSHPHEVKLPLMVRDNCFKPYLGLMAITVPSKEEREFLENASKTLREVLSRVRDENEVSVTLNDFIFSELEQLEKDIPGNWSKRREYMESVLNFVSFYSLNPPPIWKVFMTKLEAPIFRKNLPVIRDYIFRCLISSHDRKEQKLGEQIIMAFKPLGFELNEGKIEQGTSLIPNILNRSVAKEDLLVKYLTEEFINMKRDLKAVVVSDFIDFSSASEIFPGNDFDSSTCGMMSILNKLESNPITLQLNPIVIYGNTLYFNPKFKTVLCKEVEKHASLYDNILAKQKQASGYCYIEIIGAKSFKSFWKPLIIKLLNNKITQCMVVSREFLSDKWDGIKFNTYFNMSSATSKLFGIRLLSRLLAVDKDNIPAKHLWDFCSIMPEIELGMSDYLRISERKQYGWHLCEDGEFEKGISYFHPSLKTYMNTMTLKLIDEVNETSSRLIPTRKRTNEKWLAKTNLSELVKEILELSMSQDFDAAAKYSIVRYKGKKKTSSHTVNSREIIESICHCIVETVKEIDQVEDGPVLTPKVLVSERRDGIFRAEVTDCEPELRKKILAIMEDLFFKIKDQHYVVTVTCESAHGLISRLFSEGEKVKIPFGVPEAFSKKEDLTIFLKIWRRIVSNDELMGYRIPETKKKVNALLKNPKIDLRPDCRICQLLF